jgi:hypothetical protein
VAKLHKVPRKSPRQSRKSDAGGKTLKPVKEFCPISLPSNVISLRIFANRFGSDVEAQISEQNSTNDRTESLQTTEQNHYKQPNKITTNDQKSIE